MRIDGDLNQQAFTSMEVQKSQAADHSFKSKLETAMSDKDQRRLKEVCQDFEAVLLNMMLQTMRKTVPKSDLFGQDRGKEIFESLLDEEVTKNMAKAGGIGLADMLYKQLSSDAIAKQKNPAKPADGRTPE